MLQTRYERLAAAETWRNALFASQECQEHEAAGADWIIAGTTERMPRFSSAS